VIQTDGDELVAVRRAGLTQKKKTKLALLDNRAQEKSGWNTDVLQIWPMKMSISSRGSGTMKS